MTTLRLPILAAAAILAAGSLTSSNAAEESRSVLMKEAKITKAEAEATALSQLKRGKIQSAEIEREHGVLIWSFDIATPKSKNITEVQVDAKTGKVVSTQTETPSDQAKEAASEGKAEK